MNWLCDVGTDVLTVDAGLPTSVDGTLAGGDTEGAGAASVIVTASGSYATQITRLGLWGTTGRYFVVTDKVAVVIEEGAGTADSLIDASGAGAWIVDTVGSVAILFDAQAEGEEASGTTVSGDGLSEVLVSVEGAGEAVGTPIAPALPVEQPSGGWRNYFDAEYQRELSRRERERRARKRLEEESESIQEQTDREIARLLRIQEAKDARRAELYRLQGIANALRSEAWEKEAEISFGPRVSVALSRALTQGNYSALEALDRELQRAQEEEDFLLVTATMVLMDHLND